MTTVALAASVMLGVADVSHAFVYRASQAHRRVTVAGTFNNWDRNATPMKVDADGRTWRLTLNLAKGKHLYKFVLDGQTWITDPGNPRLENDGNGNDNSVLVLVPEDYEVPARRGDGLMATSAWRHRAAVPDANLDRGRMTLQLRARPGDLSRVEVEFAGGRRLRMTERALDEYVAVYSTSFSWNGKTDLTYGFRIQDGDEVRFFGPKGVTPSADSNRFQIEAKSYRPFVVPEWVERSVLYQVFPDRFANGDPKNDPADVQKWDATPTYFNRFGGDIAGILSRKSYLSDLGVGCIYFNPVLAAPSNHRYDAADHFRIDPEFGTNEEFKRLVSTFGELGIRVLFDGVYNHVGVTFPQFADVVKNGEASTAKDWFFIHSYPLQLSDPPNYEAWWGYWSMPKLNVANPEVKEHLQRFTDFWNATGIAGWRLDVANEVPHEFWREYRRWIKNENPDLWILGEIWTDGTPWLDGEQFDSVMNYPFRGIALQFLAEQKMTPSQAGQALMGLYHRHPPQVSRNMMNLLGSHDTPRFLTLAQGSRERTLMAATLQFGWVGTPSIYYGDEIGMEGGADPANRQGMRWDLVRDDNPFLGHYRRLIAARNASPALQSGDPVILGANDAEGTLIFGRVLGTSGAIVAFNRSDKPRTVRLTPPQLRRAGLSAREMIDRLSDRRYDLAEGLTLELAPVSSALLTSSNSSRPSSVSSAPAGTMTDKESS